MPDQVRADRDALKVPDEVPEDDRVGVDDARIQQGGIPVGIQLVLQFLSVRQAISKLHPKVALFPPVKFLRIRTRKINATIKQCA